MVLVLVPSILLTTTASVFWHYTLYHPWSSIVKINRPVLVDFLCRSARYLWTWGSLSQQRVFFGAHTYVLPLRMADRDWVEYVAVGGTAGRWICPPGTSHSEDEMVWLWVHGGAFGCELGAVSIVFMVELVQRMRERGIKFSVFCLDYELAPEFKYPSQCIEVAAIYHHLIYSLGIREERIIIGGDSAGSNLCCSLLLHLARPNPAIPSMKVVKTHPKRPGVVVLVSPWLSLASPAFRTTSNRKFDGITASWVECHAANYVAPDRQVFAPASWNPLRAFVPSPMPLTGFMEGKVEPVKAGEVPHGFQLLHSPYVSPAKCEDGGWLREAFPGGGKTVMEWDCKELFSEDCYAFAGTLKTAGVDPTTVVSDHGVHEWCMFDTLLPNIWKAKGNTQASITGRTVARYTTLFEEHFETTNQ